jgi:tryptophan halogenase
VLAHKPASTAAAEPLFQRVKQQQRELAAELPSNYEYLQRLHSGR